MRTPWRVPSAIIATAMLVSVASAIHGAPPASASPHDIPTSCESSSQTTARATPPEWVNSLYKLGGTVYGCFVYEGKVHQPNLYRVLAQNGRYYAVTDYEGKKIALDEANGSAWDTHGTPWGDTNAWTMASLADLYDIAWRINWAMHDFLSIMSLLLIILLVLVIIALLVKYYYHLKDKDVQDRFKLDNQWQNSIGVPMWMFGPNELACHNSFRDDMSFLANVNPPFGADLRRDPNVSHWLDTGQLPQSWVSLRLTHS